MAASNMTPHGIPAARPIFVSVDRPPEVPEPPELFVAVEEDELDVRASDEMGVEAGVSPDDAEAKAEINELRADVAVDSAELPADRPAVVDSRSVPEDANPAIDAVGAADVCEPDAAAEAVSESP